MNIFKKINRYINEFDGANLIVDIGNKQKHIFGVNTKSVVLTDKGSVFVDVLNLNFNISILTNFNLLLFIWNNLEILFCFYSF